MKRLKGNDEELLFEFFHASIDIPEDKKDLFKGFFVSNDVKKLTKAILDYQKIIMCKWEVKKIVDDISSKNVVIPNGIKNTFYEFYFDIKSLGLNDINIIDILGLEKCGLSYDKNKCHIVGSPNNSGNFPLILKYTLKKHSRILEKFFKKEIMLVINPDPKSLWNNIPSNKEAHYWKEDNSSDFSPLGSRKIVVSSKRGRSHQHVGSFRDDDYAFKHFEKSDWSVVTVSDGAGSAPYSRKGSALVCESIVSYFEGLTSLSNDKAIAFAQFDKALASLNPEDKELKNKLTNDSKKILYGAALQAHNAVKNYAENLYKTSPAFFSNESIKSALEYYHATLIFCLFKKFDYGDIFLTFGVGDCPIAAVDTNNKSTLLNWLDVGEYGGGTRFITQNDIFHSKERPPESRFQLTIIPDFSYLIHPK